MYAKKVYKRDVTCSWPLPPVTNCHTFLDPLLLSSVMYFMDGPFLKTYFFLMGPCTLAALLNGSAH